MRYSKFFLCSLFILLFITLCLFFTKISPFIPYNGDDWRYLSQYRSPLPSLDDWNPARVFPEILYPLLGYVSSYLVYPLYGSYIESISLTFSVFLSLFLIVLCYSLYEFIYKYSQSKTTALFSMLLFIVLAFFIFKSRAHENIYLFYSWALTDLVYYTISNILNSIIAVFILCSNFYPSYIFRNRYYLYGTILLIIYFSQFSLTFASIIAASCAFSIIVVRLREEQAHGILKKTISYLRHLTLFDGILCFTLACWLSAAAFDMLGARYAAFSQHEFNFSAAFSSFYKLLYSMRTGMQLMTLAALICTLAVLIYKKIRNIFSEHDVITLKTLFVLSFSSLISFSLYILIAAKTDPGFASRISATYGVFFFQILLTIFCIAYLLTEIPLLKIFAPVLLCFLCIAITNSEKRWAIPFTPAQHTLVKSWIAQARRADADGEKNVTITVPKAEWPHPREWFGEVLGHTLYSHGITSRLLHVSLKENDPRP